MDIRMSRDMLSRLIKKFADHSYEARQVGRRLQQLMPTRLNHLKNTLSARAGKKARGERFALTSQEYLEHIEEVTDIRHQALSSRIQYETHLMLFNARQTLSRMRRP